MCSFNSRLKSGSFLATFLILTSATCAKHDVLASSPPSTKEICGIIFPPMPALKIETAPLREESFATSRVNVERYDACPYDVKIIFNKAGLRLDFSRNVTLSDINAATNSRDLYMGSWRYQDGSWKLDGTVFINNGNAVVPRPIEGGLLLTATTLRRALPGAHSLPDTCFNLLLIGRDGWAAGMACDPTPSKLTPLQSLQAAPFILDATK